MSLSETVSLIIDFVSFMVSINSFFSSPLIGKDCFLLIFSGLAGLAGVLGFVGLSQPTERYGLLSVSILNFFLLSRLF
jgi:hypothetical protein